MSVRLVILVAVAGCLLTNSAAAQETALDLFQRRIMPIFRSTQPSSCVQCHLASVDLKNYILPSHEDTFVSLRDQGLINVTRPDKSKILTLIRMGEDDRDPLARRIHEKTRQAELDAFASWIQACCKDTVLVQRPPLSAQALARPDASEPVIRHARKDRVLDSFIRNVWSQRMRCFPCHTPYEIDQSNPQHAKLQQRHRDFVRNYGARMNLFKQSPKQTMRHLLAGNKHTSKALPMINLDRPRESLFVLKPTSKVPPKDEAGHPGNHLRCRPFRIRAD